MKHRQLTVVVLVLLMMTSALLSQNSLKTATAQAATDVYVGIDVAYGDIEAIKTLVNEVSAYTNLFIIGCTGITQNVTKLDETCQYLYAKGLSFIIYQEVHFGLYQNNITASNWTETAKTRWGNHFLGFYYMDEFGGKQLDMSSWTSIKSATDYEDISKQYKKQISDYTSWFRSGYTNWTDVTLFTSDYALYWFDYKAGYDTLFAEFGWNYSRQLNAALCRGAATIQNKEWGVMIAWTYTVPPYIESGEKLYDDLVLAYDNGAKYIVIFDSNEDYTQGILTEEHLNALEQFWIYVQNNPRENNDIETRTAVVLPDNYAYGFRGPEDKIWGLWPADNISYSLSVGINNLLERYGTKLDIIYDDELQPENTYGYSNLIYWNNTNQFPTLSPTPSTSSTPSSPTVAPTPTQLPNPTLSPSLTASPTASPTLKPSSTSTPRPTSTQDPQDSAFELSSFTFTVVTAVVVVGTVAALWVRKKRLA